jgi:hypothetical protein
MKGTASHHGQPLPELVSASGNIIPQQNTKIFVVKEHHIDDFLVGIRRRVAVEVLWGGTNSGCNGGRLDDSAVSLKGLRNGLTEPMNL